MTRLTPLLAVSYPKTLVVLTGFAKIRPQLPAIA